jgi:hypothetical protein
MNAWTSPSSIAPDGDPQAADDRDRDVVEVADEHHRRLDHAEMNCAPKPASNSSSFFGGTCWPRRLGCAAEHLDQRVAGERLLDLTVERAGVLPLRDEAPSSTAGRSLGMWTTIEIGTVTSATSASSGEITTSSPAHRHGEQPDVSSWLRVCCRLWRRCRCRW